MEGIIMRLIDADELKRCVEGHYEHTKYYHPYTKREKYKIPIDEVRDIIDRVPTVDIPAEAIPIDWLNCWLDRNDSIVNGMSDYAFSRMLMDFKSTVYGKGQ